MTYGSKQFPCRFQMLVFAQAIPDYVLQVLTQLLVIYSQQEIDDVIRQILWNHRSDCELPHMVSQPSCHSQHPSSTQQSLLSSRVIY